jgi:ABC-2 type transport system ATP-binding protein
VSVAVEITGLRKRYRRTVALAGIDLAVPSGSICGFLGPNGAGKSTTMKILVGLIRADGGEAFVLGRDVRDGVSVRSRTGYLPQEPHFSDRMKVRTVLGFVARRYLSGTRQALTDRVEQVMDTVGLTTKAERRVKALSGGELRRLGIAQAYIGEPDLLILDEPSVGLDPSGRREVLDLLDALRGTTTIFYSTHILDDVQRIADHIAVLDRGRIVAQGPIEEFRSGGEAAFRVAFDGDGEAVVRSLEEEAWIDRTSRVDAGRWRIEASSRQAAEARLADWLVGAGVAVREIRPERRDLEDIYLEITRTAEDEASGSSDDD